MRFWEFNKENVSYNNGHVHENSVKY